MEEKLRRAIEQLETAIAAEAGADPSNWPERYAEKQRAIEHCQRMVSRASEMDRITARRTIAAILTPQSAVSLQS